MKLIKYKVKHFAKIVGGGTPSTNNPSYWEGDTPWITPNDLTSFESVYIEKGERNITKEGLKKSSAKLLPKGTVLLTSRAPVGYVAIAKNDLSTNQGFKNLICDRNLCVPEFVYFLLKINKKYLQSNSTGSTFGELSASRIKNLYFYLPEISVQKKIVSILLKYDELIDNNRKRIELLEESARLIYREWFVYFRFPGHENVKFIDSLPERWKKYQIKDIVKTVTPRKKMKKSDYQEDGLFPCIDQSREFIGGYANDKDYLISNHLPVVIFGDHTRIVKYVDFPFVSGADGTKLIISKNRKINSEFLYFILKNTNISNYFYARHFKFLKEQLVVIPSEDICIQFGNISKSIMNQIAIFKAQNQKLAQARDILLPRLMSGKIYISEFDKDSNVVESEVEKIVN